LAALALSFAAIVALQYLVLRPAAEQARRPEPTTPAQPAPVERRAPYEPPTRSAILGAGVNAWVEPLGPAPDLELPPPD
jgi:hypothetical protein